MSNYKKKLKNSSYKKKINKMMILWQILNQNQLNQPILTIVVIIISKIIINKYLRKKKKIKIKNNKIKIYSFSNSKKTQKFQLIKLKIF